MPFQPIRSVTNRTHADEILLLLQSLGIEVQVVRAAPDADGEPSRWVILVEVSHYAKAQQVLAEEDALPSPGSPASPPIGANARRDFSHARWWLLSLVLLNIGIWWGMEQQGGSQDRATLVQFGAITSPLLRAGEWWRLVTALFLHIGVRHLVANMAVLLGLGALTLPTWGPGRFFFVYVLSGIVGNLAGFALGSGLAVKAGASGAIFGLLGALAGTRLQHLRRPHGHARFKRWHILAMVLALYGFVGGVHQPTTDHIAHFGGLIGGLLTVRVLPQFSAAPAAGREARLQWLLGLLAGGVCVVAWLYVALQ